MSFWDLKPKYWFLKPKLRITWPFSGSAAMRGLFASFYSPKILMGESALQRFGRVVAFTPLCSRKRAFIVTGKHKSYFFAKKVAKELRENHFTTEIWNKVQPEPSIKIIEDCARSIKKFEPDLVVAVGGGSTIDCAKAAWVLYEKPELTSFDIMRDPGRALRGLRKRALLAVVPTTSGTGSDSSMGTVLTDDTVDPSRKIVVADVELVPDYSILIPEFTVGMPPKLTASTGLDALAHAYESVMSHWSTDITDALASKSIELIFRYLPRVFQKTKDVEARYKMHVAATLAGLAFSNGGLALTHSLGHAIGAIFGIDHGTAVGIFIPYTLQFYAKVSDRYLQICKTLDIHSKSKEKCLSELLERFKVLMRDVEMPLTIRELGISQDTLEENLGVLIRYAYEDPSTLYSPIPITLDEFKKFFEYAYEGREIDF